MIDPKQLIKNIERSKDNEPSRFYKVRLDRSERNQPFSAALMERIRKRLDGEWLMTYPEPEPLYNKLGHFLKQPRENILFHTGSDLCIKSIFETYINPGDKILLHKPGYAMFFVYAKMFGANTITTSFDSNLKFNYHEYIDIIDKSYRMAVLENPNGFVGVAPPKDILYNFIEKCEKEGVIALIDEAYYIFHDITAAELLDSYENLIIVRTFSKAFGLAGVRAGYILSQNKNIENIYKVKAMHEINSLAILVIDELLNSPDEVFSFVDETKKNLQHFKDGFSNISIETSDSVGNFLAARIGKYVPSMKVSEALKREGILVRRPFAETNLKEWTRIGTGPIDQQQKVLDVVEKMKVKLDKP